jgi:IclR family transcriptional regulator, KDG regulon repressor
MRDTQIAQTAPIPIAQLDIATGPVAAGPISRALSLLDILADHGGPMRFVQLQQASGLAKGTLHRLLKQLLAENMLLFEPNSQRYGLGMRLIRLAHAAWESASLIDAARPTLDALADELGTTLHLACLEQGHVLYLDKRVPRPSIRMYATPGRLAPAHCTGVGKALLAFLPKAEQKQAIAQQSFKRYSRKTITTASALQRALDGIFQKGYALDNEEHEPTIICVAAPILASDGKLMGALSATSTTHVTTLTDLEKLAPRVIAAAAAIAHAAELQLLHR